jgi:hypothetical protein
MTVLPNIGVQGDDTHLILYVSRVPKLNEPVQASDLRKICYWLAAGGLARMEQSAVTSDDALGNPAFPDDAQFVIARQVKQVTFQYYDGTTWQSSWDGTTPGPDNTTPMGPPVAIGITVLLGAVDDTDEDNWKSYYHVINIPTANNPSSLMTTTTTMGGTSP